MNRRHFLKTGAGVAALGMSLNAINQFVSAEETETVKKIPIAVQVYSVRNLAKDDLAGTLKKIAEIGYKGVEFAGYYDHKAEDIRKMLDDLGLVCCGTHTAVKTLLIDEFDQTVEFNQILGNKFLIAPSGLEKALETKDGAAMTANLFNELAAKAAKHGMYVGYHAHAGDLKKIDDSTPWDRFFSQTKKEVVMQLDTGNCLNGGVAPEEVLKRYPGRALTVHLKDAGTPDGNWTIGDGKVNWKEVFELCETIGGTQWYIVEHESGTDPIASIKKCYETLKEMGKV